MDEWEITDELLATVTKKYADTIQEIEAKKFAYNMGDRKCFEPKENMFCRYCEYYSLCPLFAHLKFDADRRTAFYIEDAQTRFEGELETVKLVYRPEYLFVHYRLYTQENVIAEIEMELKTEVPQA